MAYKQVKAFNQANGGVMDGMCLQNVRLGYGISNKYLTAISAWSHTEQHRNRSIPSGLAVPVYFSYSSFGHIGVNLPSGKFWSDGMVFADLATFEKGWSNVGFLGWGESVNDVKVIEKEEEVTSKTTAILLVRTLTHENNPPESVWSNWVGLNDTQLAARLKMVYGSDWFKLHTEKINEPSTVQPYDGPQLYTKGV